MLLEKQSFFKKEKERKKEKALTTQEYSLGS
jgi:hypothetical protein